MSQKTYLSVSWVIFAIIAVLHIARVVYNWDASIGGWTVPGDLSIIAFVVASYLAYQGYRLSK